MKWSVAFALVLLITLPASASDLEIIMGRRAPTAFEGEVKQFISVKNNGSQTMTCSGSRRPRPHARRWTDRPDLRKRRPARLVAQEVSHSSGRLNSLSAMTVKVRRWSKRSHRSHTASTRSRLCPLRPRCVARRSSFKSRS
jgi:hypothetical protein